MVFRLRIYFLFLTLLLGAQLCGSPPSHAQSRLLDLLRGDKKGETAKETPETFIQKIQTYQEEAQKNLVQVRGSLSDPALDPNGELYKKLKAQESRLEELLLYYTQILDGQNKQEELKKKSDSLADQVGNWEAEPFLESTELSFSTLNSLEDQYQIQQSKLSGSERTLKALNTNLEEYKDDFKSIEAERRRTQEELENSKDPTILSDLKQKLNLLKVVAKIAEAKVLLTQQDIKNENLQLKVARNENALLEKQLSALKTHVKFTEEQLQKKLDSIVEEKKDIGKQLSQLREKLNQVQAKLARQGEQNDETGGISGTSLSGTVLQEEKTALQTKIDFLSQRFQRFDEIQETWRRRFLTYNQLVEKTQLLDWQEDTEGLLEETQRKEQLIGIGIRDLNKNLNQIHENLNRNGSLSSEQRRLLQQKETLLNDLVDAHRDYFSQLNRESRLEQNLLNEIEARTSGFSIGGQASSAWNKALKVWNYEITSIDDKPITVKKLVFVIVLTLLGFRFARKLSRWVGRKLLPKFGFEEGVAAGLQTLAFYILVTLVTLLVLYIVNVPLTIFTVLGGALAIGVGFGSQNVLRNFISGLILLAERPIKIGDLIQMDETYGTIERIGARSTLIRSFDNIHIILPNSDFLEKKVINWTLSDDLVRIAVNVGIIYGSPTREAANLIRKAVTEHGKVLPEPEPIVLFTDFGANSLDFQVLFWIRMRTMMDRRRVESDIRYRIDSLFREAGIVIAFPQRDVHLDNIKPLEIKILDKNEKAPSPDEPEKTGKEKPGKEPSLQERLEEHKAKKKGQPAAD